MARSPRGLTVVVALAVVGTVSLGVGSVLNVGSERARLRAEAAERDRQDLAASARRLEDVLASRLAAGVEAGLLVLTGGHALPPYPAAPEEILVVIHDGQGQRLSPAVAEVVRTATLLEQLPAEIRVEFGIAAELDRSGARPRAREHLLTLANSERPDVAARARFLAARLAASPALERKEFRELEGEAERHLATAERWLVHAAAIEEDVLAGADDGGGAATSMLAAFLPVAAADRDLVRGLFEGLLSRFAPGRGDALRRRLATALAAVEEVEGRIAEVFSARSAGAVGADAPPIGKSGPPRLPVQVQSAVDEAGVRRGTVAAIGIAERFLAAGLWIAARDEPRPPETEAVTTPLGPPFREARLARARRSGDDPLPWQSLLAILLLLVAFVPLGLGVVMTRRSLRRDREIVRERTELLAAVAHQLKTPVANLRLFLETLASGRVESDLERVRMQEILLAESERLGDHLERVLALARLDARVERPERQRIDVGALLDDLERRWRRIAALRKLRLEIERDPGLPPLHGDPRGLGDAIDNVVDNALRHAKDAGTVRVVATREGEGVAVRVEDDGPGIPDADRGRLFERFYRGERARSSGSGSGLGLAIARAGAEAAGGTIELESTSPAGSIFRFRLPGASG